MAGRIKRVLVFGKTGSGKSTVANMLLRGSATFPFRTDDSATGVTVNCEIKNNGDYSVTDTVGFGEAANPKKAEELLLEYMEKVGGVGYSHVVFVARAGRIDTMDELLWEAFLRIFKGTERAFVVVFTNAINADWVHVNRRALEKTFKECPFDRLIAVNFPSEGESENYCQQQRAVSRSRLNAAMDGIFQKNAYQYYVPEYCMDSDEEKDDNQSDWPWLEGSLKKESAKEYGSQSDWTWREGSFQKESAKEYGSQSDWTWREGSWPKGSVKEYGNQSHWPWLEGSWPTGPSKKYGSQSDWTWTEGSLPKESGKEYGSQSTNSAEHLKVSGILWQRKYEENNVHRAGSSKESGRGDGEQSSSSNSLELHNVQGVVQRRAEEKRIEEYRQGYSEKQKGKMKKIVKDIAKSALQYGFSLVNLVSYLCTGHGILVGALASIIDIAFN